MNPALESLRSWCSEHFSRGDSFLMVCPFCDQDIQELWQPFCVLNDWEGNPLPMPERAARTVITKSGPSRMAAAHFAVRLYWAVCPKCRELFVKVHKTTTYARKGASRARLDTLPAANETAWFALPQRKTPPVVSNLVPEGMVRDYREACWILDDSPRMSATLSRRVLADLLEQYGHIKAYTLAQQIDKFISDKTRPERVRENLHYLRELGDLSAHTKKDPEGKIIEVDHGEAEWTLRVVRELFDYFIVEPETDKTMRAGIDEKLRLAGRKPIKPLSEVEK